MRWQGRCPTRHRSRARSARRSPSSSRLPEGLALAAEPVDLEFDDVAGAQLRLGLRHSESDARRSAGVNDVARIEGHELAQVPHKVVDAEDHVGRAAVLARLAVDTQPYAERLWVGDLV